MKHPVRDRLLILLCAIAALCGAAASVAIVWGRFSLIPAIEIFGRVNNNVGDSMKIKAALIVLALVLVVFAGLLISVILPSKKKRSSSYAIQHNENGMVRISLKALDALVQRCLNQHAELKVVNSSLFSDEETLRVDVHINLQSDISMPLAISALQKQIKKYLEACSGVTVEEVRVFVDGTMAAKEDAAQSPYAIPASLLGLNPDALPGGKGGEPVETEIEVTPVVPQAEPQQATEQQEADAESADDEAQDDRDTEETADDAPKDEGDWA